MLLLCAHHLSQQTLHTKGLVPLCAAVVDEHVVVVLPCLGLQLRVVVPLPNAPIPMGSDLRWQGEMRAPASGNARTSSE